MKKTRQETDVTDCTGVILVEYNTKLLRLIK